MIVQKNRHLEAATAILGSRRRAKALLHTLEPRTEGSFQFVVQGKGVYRDRPATYTSCGCYHDLSGYSS